MCFLQLHQQGWDHLKEAWKEMGIARNGLTSWSGGQVISEMAIQANQGAR